MLSQGTRECAIITGATKGLGRALSKTFAGAGFDVVGLFRSDEGSAIELREEFNSDNLHGRFVRLDITRAEPDEVWQVVSSSEPCELTLINNAAAAFQPTPMHLLKWDDFYVSLEVAVKGTLICSHACLRAMLKAKRGTIVNVLSTAISGPSPKGFAAYATAKSALEGLTKALASAYSSRGIRVFSVSPGFMDTPLTRNWDERLRSAIINSSNGIIQDPMRVASAILALVQEPNTPGQGENYLLD